MSFSPEGLVVYVDGTAAAVPIWDHGLLYRTATRDPRLRVEVE